MVTPNESLYTAVWHAVRAHAETGGLLSTPRDTNPDAHAWALQELQEARGEDVLMLAALQEILQSGLPNMPADLPEADGPEGVQQLAGAAAEQMHSTLGMTGIVLAFPDFYRTARHPEFIEAQDIEIAQENLSYFSVTDIRQGSNAGSTPTRLLPYGRLLHAATDAQTAAELVIPTRRPQTTLVIGVEALKGYFAALAQHPESVETLKKVRNIARKAGIDPSGDMDASSIGTPNIKRVRFFTRPSG